MRILHIIGFLLFNAKLAAGQASCTFNNTVHESGTEFAPDGCMHFNCIDGQWEYNSTSSPKVCSICIISNDPHFYTFTMNPASDKSYEFHGKCNYSVIQGIPDNTNLRLPVIPGYPIEGDNDFGMYMDFQNCLSDPTKTCIDGVVFRNSHKTIISVTTNPIIQYQALGIGGLFDTSSLSFNKSELIGHPDSQVLITKVKHVMRINRGTKDFVCIILAGSNLGMKICRRVIHVLQDSGKYSLRIAGLCGRHASMKSDDWVTADGYPEFYDGLEPMFPYTYMVNTPDKNCTDQRILNRPCGNDTSPDRLHCTKSVNDNFQLFNFPPQANKDRYIEMCVNDLCLDANETAEVRQVRAEHWAMNIAEIIAADAAWIKQIERRNNILESFSEVRAAMAKRKING